MMKILCLFKMCWTRHYSSCIEDSRTNSTWTGDPLRIWCWNHGILVSQGTPISQSHSGLSGFLDFLFWTTNSPCARHTEKQTNVIRCGFNQPFEYECSVTTCVSSVALLPIWKSVAANVYILLPLVSPRRIIWNTDGMIVTAVEVLQVKKGNTRPTSILSNGLMLNSVQRGGRSVINSQSHDTALQVDIRLNLYTKVSSYLESRWGRDFLHRPWGPPSLPCSGYQVCFPGLKLSGRGADQPPPFSTEVKERLDLYLCSPSGLSLPIVGWTSPSPRETHGVHIIKKHFQLYKTHE